MDKNNLKEILQSVLQQLREAAYTNDCFWKDHKIDNCIEMLEDILNKER